MKNRFLVVLLLWSVCWGQICVAEEKSTLPLPDSGNVTLTLDEYNKLVELAGRPPKKPDAPPLPYSIKHVDMNLHVANDGVLGTVQLVGEVFHKGVSKVPLTTGMTVLDAHQNGKGVPLLQENGTHAALLPGPGEFSVALDTGMPLRIEAVDANHPNIVALVQGPLVLMAVAESQPSFEKGSLLKAKRVPNNGKGDWLAMSMDGRQITMRPFMTIDKESYSTYVTLKS